MEGANEAARRAVNAIIDKSQMNVPLCKIWKLHEPDVLSGFRNHDLKRFQEGLPWRSFEPWWLKIILKIGAFFKKLFGRKG